MIFFSWSGHKKKHFILNIFWGVLIAVLLHFAHHTGVGQAILNSAYDFLVEKDFKLNIAKAESRGQLPFSDALRLITFNQETYEASPGKNYWTPKDLLGKSINKAVQLGAKVVLVDFSVQNGAPVYCMEGTCIDDNLEFLKQLEQAVAFIRQNKQDTVILFSLAPTPPEKSSYNDQLQRLVDSSDGIIRFGSAGSFTSSTDFNTRHYRFYEEHKKGGLAGDDGVLLSIQLMSTIYYWYGRSEGERQLESLIDQLAAGRQKIYIKNISDSGGESYVISEQDTKTMGISSRYLFRVAPQKTIEELVPSHTTNIYAQYPELSLTPRTLLNWPQQGDEFSGSIVILGSTNQAMDDIYHTPIGSLPGMYLLANGINQILAGMQLHEPSLLSVICIETVIIVSAAYFFMLLDPFLAGVILVGLIYLINTPISLFLFHRFGIIIDYWFPLVGIGLHELIADLEETLARMLKSRKKT